MTGHASPHPIVITTSAHRARSSVSRRGTRWLRSIPSSSITVTTVGWMRSAGAVPADCASWRPPLDSSNSAWLIWERPALCRQTNRTRAMVFLELPRERDLTPQHPAADQVDREHHDDQYEGGAPGLRLQRLVWQQRVFEYGQGERLHWPVGVELQDVRAERGKQQRGRFATGSGDGEER